MSEQTYLEYYCEKYKPEITAAMLIFLGTQLVASFGLNYYNNRYIAIPYIVITAIIYLLHRRYENAQKRKSTN